MTKIKMPTKKTLVGEHVLTSINSLLCLCQWRWVWSMMLTSMIDTATMINYLCSNNSSTHPGYCLSSKVMRQKTSQRRPALINSVRYLMLTAKLFCTMESTIHPTVYFRTVTDLRGINISKVLTACYQNTCLMFSISPADTATNLGIVKQTTTWK